MARWWIPSGTGYVGEEPPVDGRRWVEVDPVTPDPEHLEPGRWTIWVCPECDEVYEDGFQPPSRDGWPLCENTRARHRGGNLAPELERVEVVPASSITSLEEQLARVRAERDEWKHRGERGEVSGWKGRAEKAEAERDQAERALGQREDERFHATEELAAAETRLAREQERVGALLADVEMLVELVKSNGDEWAVPLMNKRLSDFGQAYAQESFAGLYQAETQLEAVREVLEHNMPLDAVTKIEALLDPAKQRGGG